MTTLGLATDIFKHSLISRRSTALVRVISLLCILGVGVGVTAMIVVLSVMNGFDNAIRQRLLSVEPHLIVNGTIDPELIEQVKINPTVQSVNTFEAQDIILRTQEGFFSGAQSRGVSRETLQKMFTESRRLRNLEIRSRQGADFELPASSNLELKAGEVVVGGDLARSLEIYEGDEVVAVSPETLLLPAGTLPTYEKLKVVSIIQTNVPEVDAGMILYERGRAMRRFARDSSREQGIEIYLKNPYQFENLRNELKAKSLKVDSWEDRNQALFYSLKMEKIAMGLFLGLSILIASFSILTVLVLLITHKRTEIGVLMTMGLSPTRARRALTLVGLVLSSVGVFGGTAMGLILCWIIDTFPLIRLPSIYYDTRIPVLIDFRVIAGLLLVSTLIALISSWLPANFISRGRPAHLLRPVAENTV